MITIKVYVYASQTAHNIYCLCVASVLYTNLEVDHSMSVAYTAPEYVGVHFVHYAFHFVYYYMNIWLFFLFFSFFSPSPLAPPP